jgi:uncharacterized protein (TIGR02266 family)
VTPEAPLVRIQLRYPDEATFVQRFAPNVTRGGIFLASRNPLPVATVIRFEIAIIQGPPLLSGTGKVTWVRRFSPEEPQRAHGMGVQFLQIAPQCRPILEQLLERKTTPPRPAPVTGDAPAPAAHVEGGPVGVKDAFPLNGDPETWIDDQTMRQAADRARLLASRTEDVEALRVHEREDPPTLEEALADLSRLLGPRR